MWRTTRARAAFSHEAVLETMPSTNSMVSMAWWIIISPNECSSSSSSSPICVISTSLWPWPWPCDELASTHGLPKSSTGFLGKLAPE